MNNFNNIALIGNQNSGKTLLFNTLTGSNQKVGNWAGVTVEKKQGIFSFAGDKFEIIDLPGIYDINHNTSIDEKITTNFIENNPSTLYFNIIDSTNLNRALFLTLSLRGKGINMVVFLNKMDISLNLGLEIDIKKLEDYLGVSVVPISLKHNPKLETFYEAIISFKTSDNNYQLLNSKEKINYANKICSAVGITHKKHKLTNILDKYATGSVSGIIIFLIAIYLLFLFSINISGAFIDFFDILAGAIFIDGLKDVLTSIHTPEFLVLLLADGVGSGVQVVATFIPIIFSLYLFLTLLEQSGYMARAAFVADKFMRRLGISGKALVPLIVGFGCNVPGIMATRTINNNKERLTTIMMSPFMSCGARLAVYALFAAVFFPTSGANIVFLLYLVGILFAILTAVVLKKGLKNNTSSNFIIELPSYQIPSLKSLIKNTWFKLKGFVKGAGKIIIVVVALISVADNINLDQDDSILSGSAKSLTPVFAPMGISEENYGAVVGIITGILAKEVVVGTLDAVYNKDENDKGEFVFMDELENSILSIKDNFSALSQSVVDPLGFAAVGDDLEAQEVSTNTANKMQEYFDGKIGAFAYLLFILLYFPCVAAFGAMKKEIGFRWAFTGALWATTLAYCVATIFYQVANIFVNPALSLIYIIISLVVIGLFVVLLFKFANNYHTTQIEIEMIN
jgi:ferrous iron transport protein B